MHQASILMTALVLIMGGAWYAMHEMSADKTVIEAGEPTIIASVQTDLIA